MQVAKAKRDFDVKKASYDTEVNTAKAEAELAYKLQVKKETLPIKVKTRGLSLLPGNIR